jgi:glycosyltransferase involved in cell wall biosynthesis
VSERAVPRVSVLMPVFDAAATVDAAVRSILGGTFEDFEIVCVDDGSADATPARLAALAAADPRVRVVRRPHEGLVAALNHGLGLCRAPLVARMDADDLSAPERLARQVARLDGEPALDLVSCRVRIRARDASGAEAPAAGGMQRYEAWLNGLLEPEAIAAARFVESPIAHPTVLARRAVFAGGYRDGDLPEDYDLWLRRLGEGARFAKCEEALVTWFDGRARATHTDPRYRPEAFRALKLEHLRAGPLRDRDEVVVWGTGPVGKGWLRALPGVGVRVPLAVDLDPRKVGQRIHGARVVHPEGLLDAREERVVLVAVGVAGARDEIREWMEARGLPEGRAFWCVA